MSPLPGWLGREIVRLASVGSTNDEVLARARSGALPGLVVVADEQTRGRGRHGRVWHSPPADNLYVSLLARPPADARRAPPVTLAAGVAVCDALRALGCEATIKWPNDVLVGGRKAAGILTETSTRGERLEALVVGVGINVNATELPEELNATSARLARGAPVDREALLADLLARLQTWLDLHEEVGAAPVIAAWKARSHQLGRRVSATLDGDIVIGTACDLDEDAALVVETEGGARVRIVAGDVTLLPVNTC